MAWTYEPIAVLIPNTTMLKGINENGEHKNYRIIPNEGYVLHDNMRDTADPDEEGVIHLGYTARMASCGSDYDFSATATVDDYTAYGSREFFARPANEVAEIM